MKGERLAYYFKKYTQSLQVVSFKRLGNYYQDNSRQPCELVYLCPICIKNKIGVIGQDLHADDDFTLDHFPPESVGGKDTVLVCKFCNSKAGIEYDHCLKSWVNMQSFIGKVAGSKVPITLKLEDTPGNYKGSMILQGPNNFKLDQFNKYPLAKDWFKRVADGNPAHQTISFDPPNFDNVRKALLKTAYLYCFSIWGYDFVYSETGLRIRQIITNNGPHSLTNYGVLFHLNQPLPPVGLNYIFKPLPLQTFLITVELFSKDVDFKCGASILIPGADKECWEGLKAYQPTVDTQTSFNNAIIKLPENTLTAENVFPYSQTWNSRLSFRIWGEN